MSRLVRIQKSKRSRHVTTSRAMDRFGVQPRGEVWPDHGDHCRCPQHA
jgi:hypothetical protein